MTDNIRNQKLELKPIGVIKTPFKEAKGTPIQPAFAKDTAGTVEVFDDYAAGLSDLDGFERIWLIFWLDRAKSYKLKVTPYMDTQERGLFSTRAPSRPNPIGISSVELKKIEGNVIYVMGLDILDNTPLLDIKPYSFKFDCFNTTRNGWQDNVNTEKFIADERFHK